MSHYELSRQAPGERHAGFESGFQSGIVSKGTGISPVAEGSDVNKLSLQTVGWLVLLAARAGAASGCYSSAEEAGRQGKLADPPNSGYRVQTQRWDPLLKRSWATVTSCEHPERPAVTVAMGPAAPALASLSVPAAPAIGKPLAAAAPVVRAGETVRLVYQEELVRMEIAGIALASGNPGDKIRVRIIHASETQDPDQYLIGIVRGPHFLEMQP
jgi:hypothetical protein